MVYKYYNKVFNILLIIVLLLSNITYAGVSEKPTSQHVTRKEEPASTALTAENTVNNDIVVGLLKRKKRHTRMSLGYLKMSTRCLIILELKLY